MSIFQQKQNKLTNKHPSISHTYIGIKQSHSSLKKKKATIFFMWVNPCLFI